MNLPSPVPPALPPIFKNPIFWKGVGACAAIGGTAAVLWWLLSEDNGAESPPADIRKKALKNIPASFSELGLPEYIENHCQRLFVDGHFPQAVLEAFKALEERMLTRLSLNSGNLQKRLDGFALVQKVWGKDGDASQAKVVVSTGNVEEQLVIWEAHSWFVKYVRNPNAHCLVEKDRHSCLAHLKQVSFLAAQFDNATIAA